MPSQPVFSADAPTFNPSELTMLNAGYSSQGTAAAQRAQDLAQALAAMRDPAQDIRTPGASVDLLADALMQRRYGQSVQDFAQTARADTPQIAWPALSGLGQSSGGQLTGFATAAMPGPTANIAGVQAGPYPIADAFDVSERLPQGAHTLEASREPALEAAAAERSRSGSDSWSSWLHQFTAWAAPLQKNTANWDAPPPPPPSPDRGVRDQILDGAGVLGALGIGALTDGVGSAPWIATTAGVAASPFSIKNALEDINQDTALQMYKSALQYNAGLRAGAFVNGIKYAHDFN